MVEPGLVNTVSCEGCTEAEGIPNFSVENDGVAEDIVWSTVHLLQVARGDKEDMQ